VGFGKPNKKILVMILEYLNIFMPYLILGLVIAMIYDYLLSKLENEELHFNNFERIIMILFWPIFVLFSIIAFIKQFNKNE
jgi:Mn2+/Fe2+ NRAMP family transporter